MIEEWENWMIDHGNSNRTINVRRSNLISFLSFLANEDLAYVHYYLEAKSIHCKKSYHIKQKSLSNAAVETIINTPDIHTKTGFRDTVLMGLMYCTGARIGEVLSVRISDITVNGNFASADFGKIESYRNRKSESTRFRKIRVAT